MHPRTSVRSRLLLGFLLAGAIPLALGLAGCGGGSSSAGSADATGNSSGSAVDSSSKAASSTYTIGGGITGLVGDGLTLANGGDAVSPNPGDQSFTFNTAEVAGTAYDITVQLQPAGQTCAVTGASGVVGQGDVTDVQVSCTTTTFSVGGTISGLTGQGLTLANGTDSVSPAAAATVFTFPTSVLTATSFSVTVASQPTGQACAVSNGTGVILTSSVNNVSVSCAAAPP